MVTMLRAGAVLVAVVASVLGGGMAYADSTYQVSGTWTLELVKDRPTITPKMEDDTLNVSCRDHDKMSDYTFSDKNLVANSYKRVGDTGGIQVQPKLTKVGDKLTVTVTCKS